MSDAPAISATGLSKRFRLPGIPKRATLKDMVVRRVRGTGDDRFVDAIDDVSFTVRPGEALGIIGRNGSGKTTLVRLLAGVMKPDSGRVELRGTIAPLLSLGSGFNTLLTGRENARFELLMLGLNPGQVNRYMEEVIDFSELDEFIDAPVRAYSVGMMMRLAFAVAVCVDPDILLLDEVLAVGDEAFAQKCYERIHAFKRRGKTVVLVTHATHVVEQFCDTALWLDDGRVAEYGNPAAVVGAYHRKFNPSGESIPQASS